MQSTVPFEMLQIPTGRMSLLSPMMCQYGFEVENNLKFIKSLNRKPSAARLGLWSSVADIGSGMWFPQTTK